VSSWLIERFYKFLSIKIEIMEEISVTKRKGFFPKILKNVYISPNDKNKDVKYRSFLIDLSESGLSIRIEKATVEKIVLDGYLHFSIGHMVFMRSFLGEYNGPPFEAEAEIRWTRKEKDGSYSIGAQYLNIKKSAEKFLHSFLE